MYAKYTTDAIVLKSYERGESDRVYALYTRDFGLVRARASAVRTEHSKMRYALQSYSRSDVSLVKGKNGWRLAGATAIHTPIGQDIKGVATFARIAELVVRMVGGEELNTYLFETLAEAHCVLVTTRVESTVTIEIVCAARILYALGYLSTEALESTLFTHTAYASEHLFEAERLHKTLLSSINKAIAETQL
jgi:DNA repair protein RecO (recombination protein O)